MVHNNGPLARIRSLRPLTARLMALVFPLVIPALVVSGGPHKGGGGVLLLAAIPVLLLTLVAAGSGVWLAVNQVLRLRRA